jgi:hypothetical protein
VVRDGDRLIGSDPDSGFNYGASIQWYDDSPRDSPFFYYAPYRKKIGASVLLTIGGTQEYTLEYDQPYIAGSPWRVRAFGGYLGNKFENYFGVGERTLGRLGFPGTPGTAYGQASDYFDALREDRGGRTWRRYNFYDKRQLLLTANLERDYLGGLLRPLVGLKVSHLEARDYYGVEVKASSTRRRYSGRTTGTAGSGALTGDGSTCFAWASRMTRAITSPIPARASWVRSCSKGRRDGLARVRTMVT